MADKNVAKEVKDFTWTIEGSHWSHMANQMVRDIQPQPLSMEFSIGESIGLPSTWKLSLDAKLKDYGALYLNVVRTGGDPEANHFVYHARVKNREDLALDVISLEFGQDSAFTEFGKLREICKWRTLGSGNELKIHVKFVLFSPKSTPGTLSGGGEALVEDYGKLLESGDHSDFVIKVRELDGDFAEIKVHKGILVARSSVFQRMLSSGMTEAETGTMVIEDLSSLCVKIMLQYIYTGKLDEDWKKVPEEIVRAADKYNLPLLQNFLGRHLHAACTFANAMKLRRFAKLNGLELAVKNINSFIASNIDKIGY